MSKFKINNKRASSQILEFFVTERGRALTFGGSCVISILLFTGNYLPHTLAVSYYKNVIQSYNNAIERKVPDKLKERFDMAVEKLKLSDFERKFIQPFSVVGLDVVEIGTTKSRFGSWIGLPVNYSYASKHDISREQLKLRDESIPWNTEAASLLEESLILEPDEQIFGISQAILQSRSYKYFLNSFYPSATFLFVYALGNYVNRRQNLYTKPLLIRSGLYLLLGIFGYGIYSFLTDFTQVYYDTESDKKLADMGPEMIEAGIRYYDKILKRNISLRELTNENHFSVNGNVNYLLRLKSLPFTVRKQYFEERLKELRDGNKTEETEETKTDQSS